MFLRATQIESLASMRLQRVFTAVPLTTQLDVGATQMDMFVYLILAAPQERLLTCSVWYLICSYFHFLNHRLNQPGQCLQLYVGHGKAVTCLKLISNRASLATGSKDRTIRIWDVVVRCPTYSCFSFCKNCQIRSGEMSTFLLPFIFSKNSQLFFKSRLAKCSAFCWDIEME